MNENEIDKMIVDSAVAVHKGLMKDEISRIINGDIK